MHITRGNRRDHRPDLNHVMWALMVAHHAGMPMLMPPRSGHSREARDFRAVVHRPVNQLQTTDGLTSLVADSALSHEANLDQLAQTQMKGITRVTAIMSDAQAVLAHADPQAMASLQDGYCGHELASAYGGVEPRWWRIFFEHRQTQGRRSIDKPRRKQRDQEVRAIKKLCKTAFACEADAWQALLSCEQN
jgi:transposase